MNTFKYSIDNIRLGEFDLGGVLYHANYFHLYEQAREALLSSEGLPYSELVNEGKHLAIAEAHQNFKAPVYYGEKLTVEVWVEKLRQSTLTINYSISCSRGVVHTGYTLMAFVANDGGRFKTGRIPEKLLEIFSKYLHSGAGASP